MNRSELIEQIAEKSKITKKMAEDVVNLIFDSMTDSMVKGDRIEIRGLGSFVVREYGSYTGRNPRTGESIRVNSKRLPFFKVGKELKDIVDGNVSPSAGAVIEQDDTDEDTEF
jgi:integration host factor subunit beta